MVWKHNKSTATAAAPALAPQPAAAAAPAQQALPVGHPLPPPTSAALPAMTQPAAPAPQPAAAPVRTRAKRRSAEEIAAANAAAVQPVPTQAPAVPAQSWQPQPAAQPVAQPAPAAAVIHQTHPAPAVLQGGFLSLFVPVDPTKTAAAAIKRIAEQKGGEPNIFPTIYVTGGDGGGMFDRDDMNEEGSDDDLPTGRDQFAGVLLAYRLLVVAWPRAAAGAGGPKVSPKWQDVISANAGEAADVALAALKRYTMRANKPEPKGAPEPFYDALCHPSVTIEALVYEAQAGMMCVRSCSTYDSVTFTNDQITAAFPGGVVGPTPVLIKPTTWQTKGSKKRPTGWPAHGVQFTLPPAQGVPPEITEAVQSFSQFYQDAGNNPDLIEALQDWNKHTLTDDHFRVLAEVANNG